MTHPEHLRVPRPEAGTEREENRQESKLDFRAIRTLQERRRETAEHLRSLVSLKFYHLLLEKLDWEKKMLEALFSDQARKRRILSAYTLVLDPRYYEQKFLVK